CGIGEGDATVVRSRRGSVALRAKLSPAVLPGQVFLPRGFDAAPANALVDLTEPFTRVRVTALAPVAGGSEGRKEGGGPLSSWSQSSRRRSRCSGSLCWCP